MERSKHFNVKFFNLREVQENTNVSLVYLQQYFLYVLCAIFLFLIKQNSTTSINGHVEQQLGEEQCP